MILNWLQSILYGFLSGIMDILPVSAQAHRVLLLKFFGVKGNADLLHLLIHLGIFAALYFHSQTNLIRMSRAKALSRIPKRKRKRPLDVRSLMDLSLLKTTLIPVILGLFLYQYTQPLQTNLVAISAFLLINGIILYVPQFLPGSNRDSRTLSRVEGLLMGLGGGVSILPGISAVGVAASVGSVCGVERNYCLNLTLMMNMFLNLGFILLDIVGIAGSGLGGLSFAVLLRYILTGIMAFAGSFLGIRLMRHLAAERGYGMFGLYCAGLSLFMFILNLMA